MCLFADHLSHKRYLLSPILPTFSEHVCAGSCRCHLKTSFSPVSGFDGGNETDTSPPSPLSPGPAPSCPTEGGLLEARCCKTWCPGTRCPLSRDTKVDRTWQNCGQGGDTGNSFEEEPRSPLLCAGHRDTGNGCHKWENRTVWHWR